MKKRILSVFLLIAMLVTMVPVMATAAEETSASAENTDAVDLHSLYVQDGLTALFSTFGENGDTVDLSAGTWTALVGGKIATLGKPERWSLKTGGGVGFDVLCGNYFDGSYHAIDYTVMRERNEGLKLSFGLDLLPWESAFTVEYAAKYKPLYVADENDQLYVSASGELLETFEAGGNTPIDAVDFPGAIDQLGWWSSYTYNLDGVDQAGLSRGRGNQSWFYHCPSWEYKADANGEMAAAGANRNYPRLDLWIETDPFQTNHEIRTYGYYFEESEADANGIVTALFGMYRDAVAYRDNGRVNSSANNTTEDAMLKTYNYLPDERPFVQDEIGGEKKDAGFWLSHARPIDFYAVRIYNRVLTAGEQKQNCAVDVMLYYGIELSAETVKDAELMAAVYNVAFGYDLATDAAERMATGYALQTEIDEAIAAAAEAVDPADIINLYAQPESITAFFTTLYGFASTVDLTAGTWTDLVSGKTASFGVPTRWSLGENGGVGFDVLYGVLDASGNYSDTGNATQGHHNKELKLSFGLDLLPWETAFTVEYMAEYKPLYVADANGNVYLDADGNRVETFVADTDGNTPAEGVYNGPVDQLGWWSSYTYNIDGVDEAKLSTGRGNQVWCYHCPRWEYFVDENGELKAGGAGRYQSQRWYVESDPFQTNHEIRTYGYYFQESDEGNSVISALFGMYRDGVAYYDNGKSHSSANNATHQYYYEPDESPFVQDEIGGEKKDAGFWLSCSRPTDFYTVRIYNTKLTAAEQVQNRAVDVMLHYGVDMSVLDGAEAELKQSVYTAVAGFDIVTDATEKLATKLTIEDEIDEILGNADALGDAVGMYAATEHLTALFTTFGNAGNVNVGGGTWVNLVDDTKNATLGRPDDQTNFWEVRADGSVGFDIFFGQKLANGSYNAVGFGTQPLSTDRVSVTDGLRNDLHKTRLDFGIGMLPDGDFTVEYVAKYNPIYVANPDGTVATDANGNPIQYFDVLIKGAPDGAYSGVIDQIGFISSTQVARDAIATGNNTRESLIWLYGDHTESYWENEYHLPSNDQSYSHFGKQQDYHLLGSINTYAVTRDVETTGAGSTFLATADYALWLDTFTFDETTLVSDATNAKAVWFNRPDDDTCGFFLSSMTATDFYTVRIYDIALDDKQMAQNHLADIIQYYELKVNNDLFDAENAAWLEASANALRDAVLVSDPAEKLANKVAYQALLNEAADIYGPNAEKQDYNSLYVQSGLVGLYTAFKGDTSVNPWDGTWANAVNSGYGAAALKSSSLWRKGFVGVGYAMDYAEWENVIYKGKRNVGLELPSTFDLLNDFTVETFASLDGLTNEDGTRWLDDEAVTGHPYGVYTEHYSAFRFGLLQSLGFVSLHTVDGLSPTDPDNNTSINLRWHLFNRGYGSDLTENGVAIGAEIGAEHGWRNMSKDATVPVPGVMQITKVTTPGVGDVTYSIYYNDSETAEKSYAASAADYNTWKNVSYNEEQERASRFSLFNGFPATVYAVRVYDRELSMAEKLQNSFVDKAAFYGLDVSGFAGLDPAVKTRIYEMFASIDTTMDIERVTAIYKFAATKDPKNLAESMITFDRYLPITDSAYGYRVLFEVNKESYNLFTLNGYRVSFGALVAPGGVYNSIEDLTVTYANGVVSSSAAIVEVGGENGSGIYYDFAGGGALRYSAAVTAADSAHFATNMLVRGYLAIEDPSGNVTYVYDNAYENDVLDGEVSILEAATYFVNDFDGPVATQYEYMNAQVLRDILKAYDVEGRYTLSDALVLYVDAANGSDANDGLTADTAYKTVETAFAAARAHLGKAGLRGVTINLAAGKYIVTEELTLDGADILADDYYVNVIGQGDTTVLTSEVEIDLSGVDWDDYGNELVKLPQAANGRYPDLRAVYGNGALLEIAQKGSYSDEGHPYGIVEGIYFVDASDAKLPLKPLTSEQQAEVDAGNKEVSDFVRDWQLSEESEENAAYAVFEMPLEAFPLSEDDYIGAELVVNVVWNQHVMHIDHVDLSGDVALVYVPYAQFPKNTGDRDAIISESHNIRGNDFRLRNALAFLDYNDQYYYDREMGELHFAPGNISLWDEEFTLTYAALERMFVLNDVKNVSIQGLKVTGLDSKVIGADSTLSLEQASQATLFHSDKPAETLGFMTAAAVYGNNVSGLTVKNMTVTDTLGGGVILKGVSKDITVDSSSFTNLGDSAIRVGHGGHKDLSYTKDLVITNNYVNSIGTLYNTSVAIQTFAVANAAIVSNTVVNVPYTAVAIGWGWSRGVSDADDIVNGGAFWCTNVEVAYNYVSDYMQIMRDGGAFYLLSAATNDVSDAEHYNFMHHNYVHATEETGAEMYRYPYVIQEGKRRDFMGYYHDAYSSNWLDTDNVLVATTEENLYGVLIQHYEGAEAVNVQLENNYLIGFANLEELYGSAERMDADRNIYANDYVYTSAANLAANSALSATLGSAATKSSPAGANATVSAIFKAAGSSIGSSVKTSGITTASVNPAEVELYYAEELVDASQFGSKDVYTATFTDGTTEIVTYGIKGAGLEVPGAFNKNECFFYVGTSPIDVETYKLEANVTVTVTPAPGLYTATLSDGDVTVSFEVREGSLIEIPADFAKRARTPVLYLDDVKLDLSTYTMPAGDTTFEVRYEPAKYPITFTDGETTVVVNAGFGSALTAPAEFVKEGHTTVYTVNGEILDFDNYKVVGAETVTVSYEIARFVVAFEDLDGKSVASWYTYGAAVTAPAGFEKEGFTTVYMLNGVEVDFDTFTVPGENVTIKVLYEAIPDEPDVPTLKAGDINGDGRVDNKDITAVVLRASGAELDPEVYPGNCDLDGDGRVDNKDITAVVLIASGSAS